MEDDGRPPARLPWQRQPWQRRRRPRRRPPQRGGLATLALGLLPHMMLLLLLPFLLMRASVSAYPAYLLDPKGCVEKKLEVGAMMMSAPAVHDKKPRSPIRVYRGEKALLNGAEYRSGESLTVKVEGRSGLYCVEAVGDALFEDGACGGKRVTAEQILAMPIGDKGRLKDVELKAGLAGIYGAVTIAKPFLLRAPGSTPPGQEPKPEEADDDEETAFSGVAGGELVLGKVVPRLDHTVLLDRDTGMELSWTVGPNHDYVDVQVAGKGQKWVSVGVVKGKAQMVTTPAHQVLLYPDANGAVALVELKAQKAEGITPVGMDPDEIEILMTQSTPEFTLLRFRQHAKNGDGTTKGKKKPPPPPPPPTTSPAPPPPKTDTPPKPGGGGGGGGAGAGGGVLTPPKPPAVPPGGGVAPPPGGAAPPPGKEEGLRALGSVPTPKEGPAGSGRWLLQPDGANMVIWAHGGYSGKYPAIHDASDFVTVRWSAIDTGAAVAKGAAAGGGDPVMVPGVVLLLLPLLALPFWALTAVRHSPWGRSLLQRRLWGGEAATAAVAAAAGAKAVPLRAEAASIQEHAAAWAKGLWADVAGLRWGEAAFEVFVLVLLMGLTAHWFHWGRALGWDRRRALAIASGLLTITILMLVTLPAGKTGFWCRWVGLPFERAVRFHRQLGRLALLAASIHLGLSVRNAPLKWSPTPAMPVATAFGMAAYITLIFLALSAVDAVRRKAFETFKALHYVSASLLLLFTFLHLPAAIESLPFYVPTLYLSVPIVLYAADLLYRTAGSFLAATRTTRLEAWPGGVTRLEVAVPASMAPAGPGQYYFLSVPSLPKPDLHLQAPASSAITSASNSSDAAAANNNGEAQSQEQQRVDDFGGKEEGWRQQCAVAREAAEACLIQAWRAAPETWHPYSACGDIVDAVGGGGGGSGSGRRVAFTIKDCGPDTWSGRLATLAQEQQQSPSSLPQVRVDGPYGRLSLKLEEHARVLLVAGGVGITPWTSVLRWMLDERRAGRLVGLKSVDLLWVVREAAQLSWFEAFLAELLQQSPPSPAKRRAGKPAAAVAAASSSAIEDTEAALADAEAADESKVSPAGVGGEAGEVEMLEGRIRSRRRRRRRKQAAENDNAGCGQQQQQQQQHQHQHQADEEEVEGTGAGAGSAAFRPAKPPTKEAAAAIAGGSGHGARSAATVNDDEESPPVPLPLPFALHLFVSSAAAGGTRGGVTEAGLSYDAGRPDAGAWVGRWADEKQLEDEEDEEEEMNMAVLTCGPASLMAAARDAVVGKQQEGLGARIALHEEVFHW